MVASRIVDLVLFLTMVFFPGESELLRVGYIKCDLLLIVTGVLSVLIANWLNSACYNMELPSPSLPPAFGVKGVEIGVPLASYFTFEPIWTVGPTLRCFCFKLFVFLFVWVNELGVLTFPPLSPPF